MDTAPLMKRRVNRSVESTSGSTGIPTPILRAIIGHDFRYPLDTPEAFPAGNARNPPGMVMHFKFFVVDQTWNVFHYSPHSSGQITLIPISLPILVTQQNKS